MAGHNLCAITSKFSQLIAMHQPQTGAVKMFIPPPFKVDLFWPQFEFTTCVYNQITENFLLVLSLCVHDVSRSEHV